MSTRSYVGVLDPDGRTYRARYVHFDGDPDTMPFMLAAVWWHTFDRDGAATGQALGSVGGLTAGYVTNAAFGGDDRRTLYVTTSEALYQLRLDVPGFERLSGHAGS